MPLPATHNDTMLAECFSCIPAASSVCPAGQVVDQLAERAFASSASACAAGRVGMERGGCCYRLGPGAPCCAKSGPLPIPLNETTACISCVSASSSVQAPQPEPSGFPFAYVGAAAGCVALVGAALVVKRRRSASPAATSAVGMPDH